MNKLKFSSFSILPSILFLLIISTGFLFLPLSSRADREVHYRNCTELQKHLNDNNPQLTVKGFEKIQMMWRSLGYESYTVFCNGGIVINRETGTICRGYIGYSFSRIPSIADYYADWGKTNGSSNFNDSDAEKYCRLLK